jgi:hypothetical protein
MASSYLACLAFVSAFYHLPPHVLPSIQQVEAGRTGLVSANADGSADLGVMQINTRWIQPLSRHMRAPENAVRSRLVNDTCFNVATAGAIMRIYLEEEHGNLMRAVGDYHSHTPTRNAWYQTKVLSAAERLFGGPAQRQPAASFNSIDRTAAVHGLVRSGEASLSWSRATDRDRSLPP